MNDMTLEQAAKIIVQNEVAVLMMGIEHQIERQVARKSYYEFAGVSDGRVGEALFSEVDALYAPLDLRDADTVDSAYAVLIEALRGQQ